ncbi:MAG TPA: hypothetical protein VEZ11_07955 [Thermoanaerobaculia bacterium]|nr:hypothetical protein [Thermoanaerobaculia bacterium]
MTQYTTDLPARGISGSGSASRAMRCAAETGPTPSCEDVRLMHMIWIDMEHN